MLAEVSLMRRDREHTTLASFPDEAPVGQFMCCECSGTGWWDYAPYAVPGAPCMDCKGTGRMWVGLY